MRWLCRFGVAAALALGTLTGALGAEYQYNPCTNEVEKYVSLVGLSRQDATRKFAEICNDASALAEKKQIQNGDALIVRVDGNLKILYKDDAYNALAKLFSYNVKIALLCNCPDFAAMATRGTTFFNLREEVLQSRYKVEIDVEEKGRCFECESKKNSGSNPYKNHVGLIYGVTFSNGRIDSDGGAVRAHQSVRFVNCTFRNCVSAYAKAAFGGGAIHYPVDISSLKCAFTPKRFGEAFVRMTQASCSFCTFTKCSAYNNGGAIYTNNGKNGLIADCVFNQCTAGKDKNSGWGGALYNVEEIERSIFRGCEAKSDGGGGALYNVNLVTESLFDSTKAPRYAAIGNISKGVRHCTFVNCAATDTSKQFVIEDGVKVDYSIIVGTDAAFGTYKSETGKKENTNHHFLDASAAEEVFVNYNGGDFHLKPDAVADVERKPPFDRTADANAHDLDRLQYVELVTNKTERPSVCGCYRYNTEAEIVAMRKNLDIATMNPLVVTTPEDVVDPTDGRISFREACSNLMASVAAPRGMDDQWPRITFSLPSGARYIQVEGDAPLISDKMRKNPDWCVDDPVRCTPIEIDGGAKGLTVRRRDSDDSPALELCVAGRLVNLNFVNAPILVGANRAAETLGDDGMPCDTTLYATNCAFTGGNAALPLVRADADKANVHGLDFTRCSFVNPSNATAAVQFDQVSPFSAAFTCCTFTGFDKGEGTVLMPAAAGRLSFGSCTFALNGTPSDTTFADIRVGEGVTGGDLHLGDCLFADGRDRALRHPAAFTVYGSVTTDDGTARPDELMENFAGDAGAALGSAYPDRLDVGGVSHIAFPPKHSWTARLGRREIQFSDGGAFQQPETDIFGAPQTGARTSLGSRFVDDVELKGMEVDLAEDLADPYDDRISFREAIAYGLDDPRRFAGNNCLTPTFSTNVFADGDVGITLKSSISIDSKAFANGYYVWIRPGERQRLTFNTDLMGGGLFRQAAGTRLKFDDVLFSDCFNFAGPGGVLDSEGRVRFNRCRFENCFAAEARIVPATYALGEAYKPVLDTLALSDGARETVRRSIPPGYRERFDGVECALSNANAACEQTLRILRDVKLTFRERVDGAAVCMSNFLEATEGVSEPFNVFCLYAPTIAMRLNAEGTYVNEVRLAESLAAARVSMDEFEKLRRGLSGTNEVAAVSGDGGAIRLGAKAECIVYNASARGCGTIGSGGFLSNAGDFKGVNLTLTGNNATAGGCIANFGGTNQLASVAIVDNVSEVTGAVCVVGGKVGILNSIVIANAGGNVVCGNDDDLNPVSSLIGDTADPSFKADVFSSTSPVEGGDTNHLSQLYYPLKPNGAASHTGTFVFFNSDTAKAQADGLDSEWIHEICHSTNPDGHGPDAKPLFGTKLNWNAYLMYDLLGKLIQIWEDPGRYTKPIPASMGPVPNVPPAQKGARVTTFEDVVSDVDGVTSLREAATYVMAASTNGTIANVEFASAGTYTLSNQIVVPSNRTLRISATLGEVTLALAAGCSNRFFRVERGGRLELSGLVLEGGHARGRYEVGAGPADDDDGGAICNEGKLVLVDCTIQKCEANGFGGAVWSTGGMTATRCTFAGNFAQRGGGICSNDEKLRLSGVALTGNTAQDYGGGLYLVTGSNDVVATGMTITGNTARGETVQAGPNRGGGVYLTANMAEHPGTVTISGTVSGNIGGDDSRDGGTAPVSPVTFSQEVSPPHPTPRLMSAAPVLGAAPTTTFVGNTTQDILVVGSDYDTSYPVRIAENATLTLTGAVSRTGTVKVSNRMFEEGCHPQITVGSNATIRSLSGFYCDRGSPRAELVIDGGTAELSGGAFFANADMGSSGTITLRKGALLDADMGITLNSDVRTNTVSDSTVDLHGNELCVSNGARLEMSGSTLLARAFVVGDGGSAVLWGGSNVLTTVNASGAVEKPGSLAVIGGTFLADIARAGGAGQNFRFEDVVGCRIGQLVLDSSEVVFAGKSAVAIGKVTVSPGGSSDHGPCVLTFDGAAAECDGDVNMRTNDLPVTLAFRGENAILRCKGDFSFGSGTDSQDQIHTLRFDIPEAGWAEPPLRIDGTCQMSRDVAIGVPAGGWMRGESRKVPLVGFASRPAFLDDAWLESAGKDGLPPYCALGYDTRANVLQVEYVVDSTHVVCELNGEQFTLVEAALDVAKPRDTVRLIDRVTRSGPLEIPAFVTLDLNGYLLTGDDDETLPAITSNGGVLVAYSGFEVAALFGDSFTGTMRFGRTVTWDAPDGSGSVTFAKGTDVTVGREGRRPSQAYVVTTSLTDTYGLGEGWSVVVYGPAELGGARYGGCSIEVSEDVRVVTSMALDKTTLTVGGAVSFADQAYVDFLSISEGGLRTRSPVDFRYLRINDPALAAQVGVARTDMEDGTIWYHLDAAARSLVAEVDFRCYTLGDAFAIANTNGHTVTLIRNDDNAGCLAIPINRDLTFDMNGMGLREEYAGGLCFDIANGLFTVVGGGESSNMMFRVLHGDVADGALHLSGGKFAMGFFDSVIYVASSCKDASVRLTDGVSILSSATYFPIVQLDGYADCLFDNAKLRGESLPNVVALRSARITVTNDAELVSRDEVIVQNPVYSDLPEYEFTLEVSGTNSLLWTVEGTQCVASTLTAARVGPPPVNRFVCRSGNFECRKANGNAAVGFYGSVDYDVTGGRFGGAVAPLVSPGYKAVTDTVPRRNLFWRVDTIGSEGKFVAKVGDDRYESVERAFGFVPPGGTVTMIDNAVLFECIEVGKPVTLDLNGFTIQANDGRDAMVFNVAGNGTLTIVDSGSSGCISEGEISGDGTLVFEGGTLGKHASIYGTGKTTLIIRGGTFQRSITVGEGSGPRFGTVDVSGGEFYGKRYLHMIDYSYDVPPFDAPSAAQAPKSFLRGGVMHYFEHMPTNFLAEGYAYTRVFDDVYSVVKNPRSVVAEVGGREYPSLADAIAAANLSGEDVTLLADCTKDTGVITVTNKFTLSLNDYKMESFDFEIVKGGSLTVDGGYPNSICRSVCFEVGQEDGSSPGTLHLIGGRYVSFGASVVVEAGECRIDHGALLQAYDERAAVYINGGTLTMTNATILSEWLGIGQWASLEGPMALHIGGNTKVTARNPVLLDVPPNQPVDLDISGGCEFRATDNASAPFVCTAVSGAGISGGLFYGTKPDDKLLAKGYGWKATGDVSALCWTPMKIPPSNPDEILDRIRVIGDRVLSGIYEITGAVTIRENGSVKLEPNGSVGGVEVTPVIGDLPPEGGAARRPFMVGEGDVSLTIQTIPGLKYVLLRGKTPDKIDEVVASGWATGNTMTLRDTDKPENEAFYRIEVRLGD